jgi:hypothetical protein
MANVYQNRDVPVRFSALKDFTQSPSTPAVLQAATTWGNGNAHKKIRNVHWMRFALRLSHLSGEHIERF